MKFLARTSRGAIWISLLGAGVACLVLVGGLAVWLLRLDSKRSLEWYTPAAAEWTHKDGQDCGVPSIALPARVAGLWYTSLYADNGELEHCEMSFSFLRDERDHLLDAISESLVSQGFTLGPLLREDGWLATGFRACNSVSCARILVRTSGNSHLQFRWARVQ